MPPFSATCEVRWSDLDPNGHARHTAFLDWATHARLMAFASQGISTARMHEFGVGPVLFREEADYLREVSGEDRITVTFEFAAASDDWKHFRIQHLLTRQDEVPCAKVVVRGAWFDLKARKVIAPPEAIARACAALPRAKGFAILTPLGRP